MTNLLLLALWIATIVRLTNIATRLSLARAAGWSDPDSGWRRVLGGGLALTGGIFCVAAGMTARKILGPDEAGAATQHLFYIAGGCCAQILGLASRPGLKVKAVRRRAVLASVVAVIWLPMFLYGSHMAGGYRQAYGDLVDRFWLTLSYLPYDLYLLICLVDISVLCFRNANAKANGSGAPAWRAAGLRLAGLGGACGAFSALFNLVAFSLLAAGQGRGEGSSITAVTNSLSALFFAAGVLAAPAIDQAVRYRRARAEVRALQVLWSGLSEATLGMVLDHPPSSLHPLRRLELRMERYRIEIADALRITRLTEPGVAERIREAGDPEDALGAALVERSWDANAGSFDEAVFALLPPYRDHAAESTGIGVIAASFDAATRRRTNQLADAA